ncbi:MAG: hypothetical protein OHK0046_28250 [Anaerolineae bacterium]
MLAYALYTTDDSPAQVNCSASEDEICSDHVQTAIYELSNGRMTVEPGLDLMVADSTYNAFVQDNFTPMQSPQSTPRPTPEAVSQLRYL